MGRPVVIFTGQRRPHEIFLLMISVLTGVAYLVGAPPPGSVTALLPYWAIVVWAAGLATSGVIGLVASVGRDGWTLKLEQAAMLLGTGALMWYTFSVLQFGWKSLVAEAISIAWALANLTRAAQIHRDMTRPAGPAALHDRSGGSE